MSNLIHTRDISSFLFSHRKVFFKKKKKIKSKGALIKESLNANDNHAIHAAPHSSDQLF